VAPGTQFQTNTWGIIEPLGQNTIDETAIDLVLVPLICFDETGHRVGYGKGFYDRTLARCRKDCIKVGLSFFGPVEEIEGVDANDVRLDYCVTDDSVFQFTS